MNAVLELEGFGVAFGDHVVLRAVDLVLARTGCTTLMGPGGAGKSTLVRTLAGHNDAQPMLRTWGVAVYDGANLATSAQRPALLSQSARLMIATVLENVALGYRDRGALTQKEQRRCVAALLCELGLEALGGQLDARVIDLPLGTQRALAVARAVAADAPLLLLDEPSVGLDEPARTQLLALLRREADRRAVVYVSHNRRDALELGGRIALLVDGRIVEVGGTARFFEAPESTTGKHFVQTGTCYVAVSHDAGGGDDDAVETPRARPSRTSTEAPPRSARVAVPAAPRGLHWVRQNALAGLPRPGLLVDVEEDVSGLYHLNVTTLITLEETETVPADVLARFGIEGLWRPIPDMRAPSLSEADALCAQIEERMGAGRSVAVHCRAGLGRTGTVLAAFLIWEGLTALEALERVRCLQPRFVQSDEQLEFLSAYAAHRRAAPPVT